MGAFQSNASTRLRNDSPEAGTKAQEDKPADSTSI